MKVSIITACKNNENTIEDTIRSVLQQDYPFIEYLIIDGASQDNTCAIIEKYRPYLAGYISETDTGIYSALNKGIAMATGEVVGFLHADDFFAYNSFVADVVEKLKHENTEACYADLEYVRRDNPLVVIRRWTSGHYKQGMFLWGWMPPHPTFYVRRQWYVTYGGFNETFKYAADYELMLRFIHKYHIRMSYLPKVGVKMRVGGVSNRSLKNRLHAHLEDRRAWQVNALKPYFFTLWLKPLRKVWQYF